LLALNPNIEGIIENGILVKKLPQILFFDIDKLTI